MKPLRVVLLAALCVALNACRDAESPSRLPVPQLPSGKVHLRVAYAVNPRLPQMSPQQLAMLLTAMQSATREHFQVELEFSPIETVPIDALFRRIPPERATLYRDAIYDFRRQGSRELEAAFGREFRRMKEPLDGLIDYSRPYVGELAERSYEAIGSALAKYHLKSIERWRTIPALDGKPSIGDDPYNEFVMWVALGYGDLPYELVLTNQLIASVESVEPAVHGSLRGGYSNGITTYSKHSRYGTYAVWSTFAFTAGDAWTLQLRGGERYGPDEAARLSGLAAAHEIGHLLFHFGHPYQQPACLMHPVPMLAFRRWSQGLSAANCRVGSNPAMQPGAQSVYY